MRDLSEIREMNLAIHQFSKDYRHLFLNPHGYFSIEDYLENLSLRRDEHFLNYQYHYPFKVSVLEEFKDNILLTYQPSDRTHGFMGMLVRIDNSLHILFKIGCEYKNHKVHLGVNAIFITTRSLKDILDYVDQYENHINHEIFADSIGMGLNGQ